MYDWNGNGSDWNRMAWSEDFAMGFWKEKRYRLRELFELKTSKKFPKIILNIRELLGIIIT